MSDVNSPNQVLPTELVSSTGGNTSLYESNGMSKVGGSNKKRRSLKKKSSKRKPSKCGGRNKKSKKNLKRK